MTGKSKTVLVVFGLIALFLGGFVYKIKQSTAAPEVQAMIYPKPKQLPKFQLTDHNNQTFTQDQLLGKWSIMFFGYTYCPDICPTTLAALSQVAQQIPADVASKVQYIFVSVDPERDDVARLAAYVPFYHADFIGTTGTDDQIQILSKSVGAVYMKMPLGDTYQMQHTGRLFIVDPKGRRFGIFADDEQIPGSVNVDVITQDLIQIVRHY